MALTWEDKEVSFDVPFVEMRLKLGEKVIDKLDNIEDTKGNAGDRGRLIVTSLRILWHSLTSPRINLSIGFDSIISINTKIVNSRVKGTTQALHLLTISRGTRYEFIFTNLIQGSMRHFMSVVGVHKAFITSKLYRELKLRGGVVHNKKLKILPLEQVVSSMHGVWNLSSDQGSLGTFIVTNIRFVWFADVNEGFNISLPYLQVESARFNDPEHTARDVKELILYSVPRVLETPSQSPDVNPYEHGGDGNHGGWESKERVKAHKISNKEALKARCQEEWSKIEIRIRDSKFGKALVIKSTERSGHFILGFKVDPEEKLITLFKELTSLHTVFMNNPVYGVEYKWNSKSSNAAQKRDLLEDLELIEDPKNEIGNTLAAYLADEGHKKDRLPVYSSELGLAVEAVKDGYSLRKLWEVIPSY